jgi:hypothetical protein
VSSNTISFTVTGIVLPDSTKIVNEANNAYKSVNYSSSNLTNFTKVYSWFNGSTPYTSPPYPKSAAGPHPYASYHTIPWLETTPQAGGECVFFVNLVLRNAGIIGTSSADRIDYTTESAHNPISNFTSIEPGDILISNTLPHEAIVVSTSLTGANPYVTVIDSSWDYDEVIREHTIPANPTKTNLFSYLNLWNFKILRL